MSFEWLIRSSTWINRWTLKFLSKRSRLSFSSILSRHQHKSTQICLNSWKSSRQQSKYLLSALLSNAAVMFSWKHHGVSDEELQQASSDEYLLDMTNDQVEEILISLGWEKLLRKEHLMLFRKYDENLEVYSYKIFGTFNDISALLFLQVQLDLDYRMKWDDHALRLTVVDSEEKTQSDIVHWIQKFPFPLNNRDYLYVRRYCLDTSLQGSPKIVVKCHSINHPAVDDAKKCVRVQNYESSMIIQAKTKLEEKGMTFLLTYHEDAQASVPTSTYSYLAQSGIPNFVEKLHLAAKKLPKSKRLHGIDLLPQCHFLGDMPN